MGKPSETILRAIYFDQELELAIKFIKCGLSVLQNNKLYTQQHFTFLLLLSNGLERLAKLILYLHVFETENRYLTGSELKKWGHSITRLLDNILLRCYRTPYVDREFARSDFDFLKNDQHIQEMLVLLANFAMRDRYIYMDGLTDPASFSQSPQMLWEEFQRGTIPSSLLTEFLAANRLEDLVEEMNRTSICYIEKLLRAFSRLFVFGVLGAHGKRYTAYLRDFSSLQDDKFGHRIYGCWAS